MSETIQSPQVVITDDEIFEAHVGGKLSVVSEDLALDRIVPSPLDLRVGDAVANAVAIASNASTTSV